MESSIKIYSQIVEACVTYKDAVKSAAAPLLKNNVIEAPYLDSLFKSISSDYSQSLILRKLALPHARPSQYVHDNALSILIIKNGLVIEHETVHLIALIVATDYQSHLKLMKNVSKTLRRKDLVETLISAKTVEEIKALLKKDFI
jgi:ascorbate PTS system EIIA or EIIAB component